MAHLQDVLVRFETLLVILVLASLIRSGAARRFPALTTYLGIRAAFGVLLTALLWFGANDQHSAVSCAYFFSFWANCLSLAIATFFVCQEVFRKVMEPVPGLRRLGLVAFRWVSIVTMLVGIGVFAMPTLLTSTVPAVVAGPGHSVNFAAVVGTIALDLGRCVSILELCLLAFLALTIHTLGRTYRSRLFGIAFGFGLQAGADLLAYALWVRFPHLQSPVNFAYQIAITVVLLTWTAYFLVPEPAAERKMIVLAPTSVATRWNGLAAGIGQAPALAPATAPTGFFLQDIEGVVDRVLARNPVAVGGRD
jgi:hypothetical protein